MSWNNGDGVIGNVLNPISVVGNGPRLRVSAGGVEVVKPELVVNFLKESLELFRVANRVKIAIMNYVVYGRKESKLK